MHMSKKPHKLINWFRITNKELKEFKSNFGENYCSLLRKMRKYFIKKVIKNRKIE